MRLATFNVLHGRSLTDGAVDPDRFAAAVAALDCDVLALQEVDLDQPRSGGADLTALAGEALGVGPDGRRFEAALYGTPGERWRAADGSRAHGEPAYGIALVSRFPARSWRTVPLGRAPVRSPVMVPGPDGRPRLILLADEDRLAIVAELETPAGLMTVASTHLSFVPGYNALQLRRLTRALGAGHGAAGPALILGDLNLPAAVPTLVSGWRRLAAAATYPAWAPRVQFDHALARGVLPPVAAARAHQTAVSDHRALVIDLEDAGPGGGKAVSA